MTDITDIDTGLDQDEGPIFSSLTGVLAPRGEVDEDNPGHSTSRLLTSAVRPSSRRTE